MASEGRRIAVTGGAGFVGLNVLERLLTAGHDTVTIDAAEFPTAARNDFARLPGSLCELVADITDPGAVADAVAGCDAVIHAAAITAGEDREQYDARRVVEVNVLGTQTVLDAVTSSESVRRVVYVSSGAVYGDQAFGDKPIDESTPPEPETLYAVTKLAGEQLVRRHAALHATSVAIARLSAVFGPWERDTGVRDSISPMYLLANAKRSGARIVAGTYARRNWLYARDAAAALSSLTLIPDLAHDIYNVTPEEWFEPMEWAHHLGVELATESRNHDAPVVALPDEIGQSDPRAPVANDRIRRTLTDWPAFTPEEAFLDYADWLEDHDAHR